ncbi:hypothetical protein ACFXCZ_31830 [Streptomyces sp. NPDC059396]|uniref:hypothetical protein n=1 Tax=Streptomyces sp. NPDC059396 TaxID=3346819 RepID=UPI00368F9A14
MRSNGHVIAVLAAGVAVGLSVTGTAVGAAGAGLDSTEQSVAEVRPLGTCEVAGHICGNVHNRDDRYSLLITNDWGKRHKSSTWRLLKPGQDGNDVGVRDVDGYWVGSGCKVKRSLGLRTIGPGWHKVRNGQKLQIVDIRC